MNIDNGAQVNVTSGATTQGQVSCAIDSGVLQASSNLHPELRDPEWCNQLIFAVENGSRAPSTSHGKDVQIYSGSLHHSGTNSKWELVNRSGLLIEHAEVQVTSADCYRRGDVMYWDGTLFHRRRHANRNKLGINDSSTAT